MSEHYMQAAVVAFVFALFLGIAYEGVRMLRKEKAEDDDSDDGPIEEMAQKTALFLKQHILRHAISGFIVFAASVCADVFITHRILTKNKDTFSRKVEIMWSDGLISGGSVLTTRGFPNQTNGVVLGFSNDGRVFWKQ